MEKRKINKILIIIGLFLILFLSYTTPIFLFLGSAVVAYGIVSLRKTRENKEITGVKKIVLIIINTIVIVIITYFIYITLIFAVVLVGQRMGQKPPKDCPGVNISLEKYVCNSKEINLTIKNNGYSVDNVSILISKEGIKSPGVVEATDAINQGETIEAGPFSLLPKDKVVVIIPMKNGEVCMLNSIEKNITCPSP